MEPDYDALLLRDTEPLRAAMARASAHPTQASRRRALKQELTGLRIERMSLAAQLVFHVLQRVADLDDAVGTAARYEVALRAFLVQVSPIPSCDLGEAREFGWSEAARNWIESAASDGDRSVRGAVLDHLMHVLGLRPIAGLEPPPAGPMAPVSVVTDVVVDGAVRIIESSSLPARTRNHAALILLLRSLAAMRGDEVARLRRDDIHIGPPTVVGICAAAGAFLKTGNAPREIELRAPSPKLLSLLTEAVGASRSDGRIFSNNEFSEAASLATEALRICAADRNVNLMAMRRLPIDREMGALLSPSMQAPDRAVQLRTGLLQISARAGHGTGFTVANDYASAHAQWLLSHVSASRSLGVQFTPRVLLQVFQGVTSAAARKRVQRGRPYVAPVASSSPAKPPPHPAGGMAGPRRAIGAGVRLQYLFARLSAVSPAGAELRISIDSAVAATLEDCLERTRVTPVPWAGRLSLRQTHALAELYGCVKDSSRSLRDPALRSLPFRRANEGWVFRSFQDLQGWTEVLQAIQRVGFEVRVEMGGRAATESRDACEAYCSSRQFMYSERQRRGRNLQDLVEVDLRRQGWSADLSQRTVAVAVLLFLFEKEGATSEDQGAR